MMIATQSIVSVGSLSARCNAPLNRVVKAIEALDIRPAMNIDGVDYLAVVAAQRVAEYVGTPTLVVRHAADAGDAK